MVQPLCLLIMLSAAVAACLPFVSSRGRCLSLAVAFYGTYTVALICRGSGPLFGSVIGTGPGNCSPSW